MTAMCRIEQTVIGLVGMRVFRPGARAWFMALATLAMGGSIRLMPMGMCIGYGPWAMCIGGLAHDRA